MPSSSSTASTTRRRRSSSTTSVLQPIQTNIKPVPSPQRSPKRPQQCRRKSESSDTGRRRHRVTFANPIISTTNALANLQIAPKSPSDSEPSVQTLPLPGAPQCVALLERDCFTALPKKFGAPTIPPVQGQPYRIGLCRSETNRRSAGYGMFATRNIPRGGVILVERAVMVVSSSCLGSCGPIDQLLDPTVQKAVMRLTDAHAGPSGATLQGIIRTNGIQVEIGSRDCFGVFLDVSRVNHSCGPNAFYRWDPTSLSITLEAVRPIPAGTEITIPYIDCLQPRADRRKQLKSLYRFDCYCQHCDIHWSESNAAAKSDMNRRELLEFNSRTPTFEDWCENPKAPDDALIKLHIRALEVRAAEGLELFQYKKHIDLIAMCYGALEDTKNFRCWMERGRNASAGGTPGYEAGVMGIWIQDPRKFPVWGWKRSAASAPR